MMPPSTKPNPSTRKTRFLGKVSPEKLAEIRAAVPSDAQDLKIGVTGTGKFPNFEYVRKDCTLRFSSRKMTLLGSGAFRKGNVVAVEIREPAAQQGK